MKTSGPQISAGSSGRDSTAVCDYCGRDSGLLLNDGWPDDWLFDPRAPVAEKAIACTAKVCQRAWSRDAGKRTRGMPGSAVEHEA